MRALFRNTFSAAMRLDIRLLEYALAKAPAALPLTGQDGASTVQCMGIVSKIACVVLLSASSVFLGATNVIFDTDMGNDIDDVVALTMLYKYCGEGSARLLAVATNKDHPNSAEFLRIMNAHYGHAGTPVCVGKTEKTKWDKLFCTPVCAMKDSNGNPKFPRADASVVREAVKGLREALSKAPDNSVVYISVGFSSNIAALMESEADEHSPLGGRDLAAKKIKMFSVMGGNFSDANYREYNVAGDIPAAKKFFGNPPSDIVFAGYEIGMQTFYPLGRAEEFLGKDNPAAAACAAFMSNTGEKGSTARLRPNWDPSAVLAAVEPEYFEYSPKGDVFVGSGGETSFKQNPKGKCYFIMPLDKEGAKKVSERIMLKASGM